MGLKKHRTSKHGPWKDGPKPAPRKRTARASAPKAYIPDLTPDYDVADPVTGTEPIDRPQAAQPADTHAGRKQRPGARGFLFYFPDAILEAANVSRVGNEQHNSGQPIHWAFDKSTDHADCIVRHLIDFDEGDSDALDHAGKVLWRAAALYQTLLEKRDPELHARRDAQRARAAKGER